MLPLTAMKGLATVGVLVLLWLTSCGKRIESQVQETVRVFDNALLSADAVEIQSVRKSGDHVIAEIKVTTAVKMKRKDGRWVIEEIRIGDRRWEKAEHILFVINEQRSETTRRQLTLISEGIRRYKERNGKVPQVPDYETLIDLLSPRYLDQIIRIDAWSNPFSYQSSSENTFELRSTGPDGAFGTQDDLLLLGC